MNSDLQETDKHPINKDYKTNLSELLFLLLRTAHKARDFCTLTLDTLPAHPGDTESVIVSPLERTPMLRHPPLLPTFIAGRALKCGWAVLVCVPCRHGYEMWHWPGSCSAWPHGGGGNSSSVSLTFSATSGLPERRHLLLVEGEGKSEFTVVLLCKVPVSPWLLLPSNPFKSRRGDRRDTGVGVVSLGRLTVKIPRDLQGLARKTSLQLMLWPESPEESVRP